MHPKSYTFRGHECYSHIADINQRCSCCTSNVVSLPIYQRKDQTCTTRNRNVPRWFQQLHHHPSSYSPGSWWTSSTCIKSCFYLPVLCFWPPAECKSIMFFKKLSRHLMTRMQHMVAFWYCWKLCRQERWTKTFKQLKDADKQIQLSHFKPQLIQQLYKSPGINNKSIQTIFYRLHSHIYKILPRSVLLFPWRNSISIVL